MAKTLCTIALRILVFGATLVAAIVMATSNQTVDLITFTFETNYNDWPAFKYYVITNGIASSYSLLILFLPSGSLLWRLVVPLDVIILGLLSSSSGGAFDTYNCMKEGNSDVSWSPICRQLVPAFCNHVLGALAAGIVGVATHAFLSLYSFHVVFNPLLLDRD